FQVKSRIAEIAEITVKIFKDVIEDPADYAQIRRFADVFIPETLKILKAYTQLETSGAGGAGVEAAKSSAVNVLDTIIGSYKKQYDALFANQVIDIETDIKVLETMLKREGLTSGDFEIH
ncbi:MAG: 5-bromo-4-chloroindolyl phosphate hydrolysis family protein, partial [Oscillospiraceae bacterium]|nr:5-bromo-4-chloroindolyl phosphate hydrolysis family protein [Oscillospiraceae bacterium]